MKFYALKQIETRRLIIRLVQLGDEIELNKAINNSLDVLQKWMPWAQDPSLETTRNYVQKAVFARASETIKDFAMVVIHKKDQKIIGASGYNDRSDASQGLYEIGYWCDISYQGQGYVTEYVNALTRYALSQLEAKLIVIRMHVNNLKSMAVAERLHFQNQGIKPSITHPNAKDYYFTCENLESLPALDCSWKYEKNKKIIKKISKIMAWSKNELKIKDEKAWAGSKAIAQTPWSEVFEINTGEKIVYLKQTPKDLFLEVEIIKLLSQKSNFKELPTLIKANKNLCAFIMEKSGDLTLREHFSGKLDQDLFLKAIEIYKNLQKSSINHVDALIKKGVPDWRLNKFPELYNQLISSEKFLTEHGLDAEQQEKLQSNKNQIKNRCEKLSSYKIPECLNHSDFHDNNMVYDQSTKSIAIIDLAEMAINHPFFSIMACLGAVKNTYNLTEEVYQLLEEQVYSGFLNNQKDLKEILGLIKILNPLYLLFNQKRFLDSIHLPFDPRNPISVKQHGRIKQGFMWFIKNIEEKFINL
ncbi:MAG: GNAT family N-acetyltransferase [Gammaproteobacteria bacterium]